MSGNPAPARLYPEDGFRKKKIPQGQTLRDERKGAGCVGSVAILAASTATATVETTAAAAATTTATIAATAATETTAAAAAATAAAAFAGLPGFGFAHTQGPAHQFVILKSLNGTLSLFPVGHFNKSEPAGTTGVPVEQDAGGLNDAIGAKGFAQLFFLELVSQISDIYIHFVTTLIRDAHRSKGSPQAVRSPAGNP